MVVKFFHPVVIADIAPALGADRPVLPHGVVIVLIREIHFCIFIGIHHRQYPFRTVPSSGHWVFKEWADTVPIKWCAIFVFAGVADQAAEVDEGGVEVD